MKLPVTEVERFVPQPGDVLFVHVDQRLSAQAAETIKQRFLTMIGRDDVKVVVLDQGMTVKVGQP